MREWRRLSILQADLLTANLRIRDDLISLEVFLVHIDGGDLAVFIGGIVVYAARGIAAGGIDRDFRLVLNHYTAAYVRYACQNVE